MQSGGLQQSQSIALSIATKLKLVIGCMLIKTGTRMMITMLQCCNVDKDKDDDYNVDKVKDLMHEDDD